jgi:hypothetical protein
MLFLVLESYIQQTVVSPAIARRTAKHFCQNQLADDVLILKPMETLIVLTSIPASLGLALAVQICALKVILWAIQLRI